MKKILLTAVLTLIVVNSASSQVGIGTETPDASAALEVRSTTKGFLPPRMTEDERNNISSPAQGLVIYCSNCGTNGEAQVNNGTEWTNMTGGAAAGFVCGTSTVTFTYNGESVTYGTVLREYGGEVGSKCWLDRNLGASQVASASDPSNTDAFGDLFQWGRGDDGHQIRTSDTRNELSSSDQPGHGDFILSPNADDDYDWLVSKNDNLWEGINGLNNPCPSGFRVPTEEEWEAEWDSWDGTLDGSTPPSSNNNATGAINSPLKLPLAGYRSSKEGTLGSEPPYSIGYYWSSTVKYDGYHRSRYFDIGIFANYMFTWNRASGYSVRCIKD